MSRENIRFGIKIEGDSRGAVRATQATGRELKELRSHFERTQKQGRQMTDQLKRMRRTMEGVAGAAGIALSTQSLTNWTQASVRAVAETDRLADQLGVVSERLQGWQYAAETAGIQTDRVNDALQEMSQRAAEARAEGAGPLADVAEQLNINLGSTRETLYSVADAIESAESRSEQMRIAAAAFGDEGRTLVRILDEGREGVQGYEQELQRLGGTFSGELGGKTREVQAEFALLNRVMKANLQEGYLEGLTEGSERLSDALGDPQFQKGLNELGEFIGESISYLVNNADTIKDVSRSIAMMWAGKKVGDLIPGKWSSLIGAGTGLAAGETWRLMEGSGSAQAADRGSRTSDPVDLGWGQAIEDTEEQIARLREAAQDPMQSGVLDADTFLDAEGLDRMRQGLEVLEATRKAVEALDASSAEMDPIVIDITGGMVDPAQKAEGQAAQLAQHQAQQAYAEWEAEQEKLAERLEQNWDNMLDGMQEAFATTFSEMIEDGVGDFEDLADRLMSVWSDALGQMASQGLMSGMQSGDFASAFGFGAEGSNATRGLGGASIAGMGASAAGANEGGRMGASLGAMAPALMGAGPWGIAAGAVLGMVGGDLLGGSDWETKEVGYEIGVTAGKVQAQEYKKQVKEGGLFSGGDSRTKTSAIGDELRHDLQLTFESVQDETADLAESLGFASDSLEHFSRVPEKIEGEMSGEELMRTFEERFGDAAAHAVMPLYSLRDAGESAAETLERVADSMQYLSDMPQEAQPSGLNLQALEGDVPTAYEAIEQTYRDLLGYGEGKIRDADRRIGYWTEELSAKNATDLDNFAERLLEQSVHFGQPTGGTNEDARPEEVRQHVESLYDVVERLGNVADLSAEYTEGSGRDSRNVSLQGREVYEQALADIEDQGYVRDEIADALGEGLEGFREEFGTWAEALSELGSDAAKKLAEQVQAFEEADALMEELGGEDKAKESMGRFYELMWSESEREQQQLERDRKALERAFGEMDRDVPETREQFRQLASGLDVSTKRGRELYAQLIELAPAFDRLRSSAEESAKDALSDLEDAVSRRRSEIEEQMQEQLDAEKRAYEQRLETLEAERQAARESEQRWGRINDAARSALDGLTEETNPGAYRDQAMDLLRNRGAEADPERLQRALKTATDIDPSRYGSAQELAREEAETAQLIGQIEERSGRELTTAERQLRTLDERIRQARTQHQDQLDQIRTEHEQRIERLDEQLDTAQRQVDAALGTQEATYSVKEAVSRVESAINGLGSSSGDGSTGGSGGGGSGGSSSGGSGSDDDGSSGGGTGGRIGSSDLEDWIRGGAGAEERAARAIAASMSGGVPTPLYEQYTDGFSSSDLKASGTPEKIAEAYGFELPRFAAGGMHGGGLALAGEKGTELINVGPSRIFDADTTRDLFDRLGGGGLDQRLIELIDRRLVPLLRELLETEAQGARASVRSERHLSALKEIERQREASQ
ncbi:MAG: hypothetical protein ACLFSI_02630 [Halorhodospira sp.]